jgi:polyisoprenoid-binding protein YceI
VAVTAVAARPAAWLAALLPVVLLLAPMAGRASRLDPASDIAFLLETRWGQVLEGRFPVFEGQVDTLADGRRQVHLDLSAADVEITGHRAYTRVTRGKGFFDAEAHPRVRFVSEPFPESLLQAGGTLAGEVSIRGITRHEVFTVRPARCDAPGRACPVEVTGVVDRAHYGLDRWRFAIGDSVRFMLAIRTRDGT